MKDKLLNKSAANRPAGQEDSRRAGLAASIKEAGRGHGGRFAWRVLSLVMVLTMLINSVSFAVDGGLSPVASMAQEDVDTIFVDDDVSEQETELGSDTGAEYGDDLSEKTYPYEFQTEKTVLLSQIFTMHMLPVLMQNVEMVLLPGGEAQPVEPSQLLMVEPLMDEYQMIYDYRITALQPFEEVRLTVYLIDDVYTLVMTNLPRETDHYDLSGIDGSDTYDIEPLADVSEPVIVEPEQTDADGYGVDAPEDIYDAPIEVPVEESAELPVEESAEVPADAPVEAPADETVEGPVEASKEPTAEDQAAEAQEERTEVYNDETLNETPGEEQTEVYSQIETEDAVETPVEMNDAALQDGEEPDEIEAMLPLLMEAAEETGTTRAYALTIGERTPLGEILDALDIDADKVMKAETQTDNLAVEGSAGDRPGDWTAVLTSADAATLQLTLEDNSTVNITVKPLATVAAEDAAKTYGEADPELTAAVTGLMNGDTVDYSVNRKTGETAGTYAITPSGDQEQGKYDVRYVEGAFTINPKALTITADSATKQWTGNPLSLDADSYSSDELVAGDTIARVDLPGEKTSLGTCEIEPQNAVIKNASNEDVTASYAITYVKGSLTVTLPDGLLEKELLAFNGDLANYRIIVNPDAHILTEDGSSFTLKDTFSDNQSIDYGSVKTASSTGEDVTYDYSGNTGTYTIPDGSMVTITYTTRVKGEVGKTVSFNNTAVLGRMEGKDFVAGPNVSVNKSGTITPTGSDISGTGGVYSIELYAYADGHMEQGLEGAVFRMLDSNMRPMVYTAGERSGEPITFVTGTNGYATIALSDEADGLSIQKNTVYFLEMVEAPYQTNGGERVYYQKDNNYYSFLITDEPNYTYGGIYSYYNGDVLKVRCYPEAKGINITKRFSGNYTLTDAQKNAIRFVLQKEALGTASGWVDVESHTYDEFSYGSINFNTGREGGAELEDFATYRVIEENALPAELADTIEGKTSVTVSYQQDGVPVTDDSNEFFVDPDDKLAFSYDYAFTNEYVDHKLTVINIDGNSGAVLPGAVFEVYAISDDGTPVAAYTADEDGSITVRRGDAQANYAANTLYYAVESEAPQGYYIPGNPQKIYFYFSEDGSGIPEGVPAGAVATDLTTSYNTVTIPNNGESVNVPVTVVWGVNGDETWPENVSKVAVGLYKSVGGAAVQSVTKDDRPMTLELTKDKFYDTTTFAGLPAREDGKDVVYSVKEEGVYSDDANIIAQFANTSSISGTGWYVVNNQAAISLRIVKEWRDQSDAVLSDTTDKPEVTFALYRTTKQGESSYTHKELVDFLSDAARIRSGLALSGDDWSITVESLPKTDKEDNLYYYYALEDVPDNQEDTYAIEAATDSQPRTLKIINKQTPVTVTIKVKDLEKTYGDPDGDYEFEADVKEPGANVRITGPNDSGNYTAEVTAANGEISDITFTVTRDSSDDAGVYAIVPSGDALQAGYRVLYESGKLTINRAEVAVTAGAKKVYGEEDPDLFNVEGLKNGDDSSVLAFTVSREEGEDVGSYPITLEGNSVQGNYVVSYDRTNAMLRITPAEAIVRPSSAEKVYGEDDPVFTAEVDGLKFSDAPTTISYDLTRDPGENIGKYPITATGEAQQGNYTVTYKAGAKFEITPAPLTVKAESAEKTYGDSDPEWEVTVDGMQANDDGGTLSSVLDEETGARTYSYTIREGETEKALLTFAVNRQKGEDVGEYKITPSGTTSQGNYTIKFEEGSLEIQHAELTVSPDRIMKAIGLAEDPLLTATVTGWKGEDDTAEATWEIGEGENAGVVTWTYTLGDATLLTFTLKRDAGEDEGEYPITAAGEQRQSNYIVDYEPGAFGILAILDVDVMQPLVDYADADANPQYTYTATLDLAGSGLTEYNKNGFELIDGTLSQTFTLPAEDKSGMKTLKIPGGAKLTVRQDTTNDDYVTTLRLDGVAYANPDDPMLCRIDDVETYHEIAFGHNRISLPVAARASTSQAEEGAKLLEGREGAMGIPDGDSESIDADFADKMHSKIGYVLPTDKYYMYDHASLYTMAGEAIEGASNVSAIRYDRESGKWLYKVGEGDFREADDNSRLVLFYLPKYVCKIGTEKFYSIKAAVDYVKDNITEKTATIEMLIGDYSIRSANEAVTIPEGYTITITTAATEYEGTGRAVISRSAGYSAGHLFYNDGRLTFDKIILDGKGVQATDALVFNRDHQPILEIKEDAEFRNARGNNGGAVYVKSGTATVNGALSDNTANHGGAVYVNAGTVTLDGALNGNSATNGGAVYVNGGNVTLSGGVTNNSAASGGAVYMANGELTVSGTVGAADAGNSATNGGAVYMSNGKLNVTETGSLTGNNAINGGALYQTGGTLTVSGSVTGNSATNGGALYQTQTGSTATVSGSVTGNSATNGGALYQTDGTLTVSGSVTGNSATNGGAVYMTSGTANVVGTIGNNVADGSGGAYYIEGGTLNITDGTTSGNVAEGNGGMLYGTNGTVTISAGTFNGNKANGNGGVICYGGAGTVTIKGGAFTGNSASYGGVVYQFAGTVTLSAGTMGGTEDGVANNAKNGSAVYATGGATALSGVVIRGNTSSEGGAVGFGSASARVTFSENTVVSGNTMNGEACNVYLDIDSDQVINSAGLGNNANIGIYVSDAMRYRHGDMGTNFGSWGLASDSNVRKFVNDRHDYLIAWFSNSRLIWSAPLTYNLRYLNAFQNSQLKDQFPPISLGSQIRDNTVYYPHSATNEIYNLVTEIGYNDANRVYACTFALKATAWDEFITSVDWDSEAQRWVFKHGDTNVMKDGTNDTLYIYYSEAAYISITNNSGYDLRINRLEVMGRNVVAMNYGYPTVVNYRTQDTLLPIADASNVVTGTDIVVQNGGYVKLLLPGACTRAWSLSGGIDGAGGGIAYTLDSLNNTEIQTIADPGAFTLSGTTLANGYTYDILFGKMTPICKVVDNGEEHAFATLNDAWDYIKSPEHNLTTATIQMLMDYLQPGKDVLKIDESGYNITLTTAAASGGIYNYTGDGISADGSAPRATISRDTDNNGAAIIYDAASGSDSSLTITNMIFDGKALAKSGNGGAISTRNCEVVVDNSEFKGYRATRGGALFVSHGGKDDGQGQTDEAGDLVGGLKITNSTFSDCRSTFNQDKAGGGAVWTTAKYLTVRDCTFTDCACTDTSQGQGGAVFHNIVDGKTFNFKEYDTDSGNASYASGYSAGTKSVITGCKFYDCYVMGSAGGALETDAQDVTVGRCEFHNCRSNSQHGGGALIDYARDQKEPNENWPCTLEIYDTIFDNCRSENANWNQNNGCGGAVRTTARDNKFTNCVFTDAMSKDRGGAIAVSSQNANSLEIYGCAFENCESQSTAGGGAISCPVVILKVGDYEAPDGTVKHTTFKNCTATGSGGAILQGRNVAGSSATLENCGFENCASTNGAGGALWTYAKELSVTGSSEEKVLFKNCTASGDGGAIKHTDANPTPTSSTISNCAFENCTSGLNGGAANLAAATITVTDVSVTGCTAVNQGGGMGIWPKGSSGTTLTNCTFDDNSLSASTSKGGSLYFGGNPATLTKVSVANSTAADGGGIYKESSNLYLKETTISNCKATISGGGLRSGATLYLQENTLISDCYAATSGGGVYNGTTTIEGGSKITGCYAPRGGGFYSINQLTIKTGGDAITDCHARDVSIAKDGAVTLAKAATAGNEGGGIYKVNAGNLLMEDQAGASNIKGCTAYDGGGVYSNATFSLRYGSVSGNSASHDGGGIYMNTGTLNLTTGAANNNATVSGNTAGNNGGGVYHATGTLNMYYNGSITGNTAGNNGGGVYHAAGNMYIYNDGSITGNTAKNNGGGVYHAAGAFTMKNTATIAGNIAGSNGGGVYYAGGTFIMSGGIIGAEGNGNTAAIGGGVYVADGQTMKMNDNTNSAITYNAAATVGGGIAVGGPNVLLDFYNMVTVRHNTMGSQNAECNVYLDQDLNTVIKNKDLNANAYIGVYASDAQDAGHGVPGKPFATYTNTNNLNVYHNDRRQYLYGVKGSSNNEVVWTEFVCKITDGEGNLLYKDANGTPAVYDILETVANGAFNALNTTATPNLYCQNEDGTYSQYTDEKGDGYQVQMLVQEYELISGRQIKLDQAAKRKVILTTASTVEDECGFKYIGDARFNATIKRTAATSAMVYVGGTNKWELTLGSITFDDAAYAANQEGAIVRIDSNGSKIILENGAVLQNGKTANKSGGAVYISNANSTFVMNAGSKIENCTAGTANGGGVALNSGTFTMNGGTISGCSAANGGGVWMSNTSKLYMNGGTITGNNATGTGGGISLNNNNSRITFSGYCTVTDNTLNGTTRCNIQLTQDKYEIINANGLDGRSEIGIYTDGLESNKSSIYFKHGLSGTPFGTWAVNEDNLFCFVNDRSPNLRGFQSVNTSDTKIYWEYHPLLTVTKNVSSDWVYDHDTAEFEFKVQLPAELFEKHSTKYGDMTFDNNGLATVKLKDGESATAILPDNFDKAGYAVTEQLSDAQKADYTTKATRNEKAYTFEEENPMTVVGTLGENIGTENSTSLSSPSFTNTRVTGELTVSKKVVSVLDQDFQENFSFTLTLKDPTITKRYSTVKRDAAGHTTSGELSFTEGVAVFTLKHGEFLTIQGLPTDLGYTVEETLSESQKTMVRTTVSKDGAEAVSATKQEGIIGEKSTADNAYASEVVFENTFLEIVCKITNRSRELLYIRESNGNLSEAVFAHLEDAFAQINSGNLRTSRNGTVSGTLRIEMVVPKYTMEKTAALNSGKTVILSTALTTDTDSFPYNKGADDGNGNVSTVIRGFANDSMIVDRGVLTIDKVTLDGASKAETLITANANGGIVRVAGAVRLTVNSGATLQNSAVSGNGGAVWLGSGASIAMNGTLSNCAAANGGGVYAENSFAGITTTGTIVGCKATDANGGAIAASTGGSVNLYAGTVLKGNAAEGDGGAVYSETGVVLRGTIGGTESGEGNEAKAAGGGVYMGENALFTMYAGSSVNGNKAANGGGLAAHSTARIAGGTITGNRATENGGAVYASSNAAVTISGTASIAQNEAKKGGAVYDDGSVTLAGGSMTANIASDKGGAVYVTDGQTFTMSGGSVKDGNKSPEGAISTGAGAVLAFSGNAIVTENTDTAGTKRMNVYLGYDSNSIITTSGLGTGANIGVYVADGVPEEESVPDHVDNPIYADHGLSARNFGTYTGSNASGARLNKFVNDRDTSLTGLPGASISGSNNNYVVWSGKGLQLKVSKLESNGTATPAGEISFTLTNSDGVQVWSGKSAVDGLVTIPYGAEEKANGNVATFAPKRTYTLEQIAANAETVRPAGVWKVTIARDNAVTWEAVPDEAESVDRTIEITSSKKPGEKAYLGEIFDVSNDAKPTLTYKAMGGKLSDSKDERTDTIGFTTIETSHKYTIKETNPTWDSHVFKNWATMEAKPTAEDGTELSDTELGEKGYFEYEQDGEIVFFRGTAEEKNAQGSSKGDMTLYAQWDEVVCKITDRSGTLLYINGSPAVYGSLEEGFAAYNAANAYSFTYANGSRGTARMIEMLIPEYTLDEPVTLERGKTVMLTTAPTTDKDGYAYTGVEGSVCVITRGDSCTGSMLTNHSNLTLKNIELDGGAGEGTEAVVCDGGIVNNAQTSAVLYIIDGAILRNSKIEGNGAAVHVGAGTTVYFTGGKIAENKCVASKGSDEDNDKDKVEGKGAGIYLAKDGKLYLSGKPSFENNFSEAALPENATNGGEAYTQARQDIYIEGAAEEGQALASITLTGNLDDTIPAGSIWVWAEGDDNTQPNHYYMLKQFAVLSSIFLGEVSDATYNAFRNAREDADTDCGGEYLRGQSGDNIGSTRCVYWTGGFDFSFLKIDGFGKPLSGATFALYKAYTSAEDNTPYQKGGKGGKGETATASDGIDADRFPDPEDSSKAQEKGTVLFSKIAPSVYYMVETTPPEGYVANSAEATTIYRLTISSDGAAKLERKWLDEADTAYQEVYKVETQAAAEATESEPAKPAVYQYHVINISTQTRKAILRKVEENTHKSLEGAVFEILRADRSPVSGTDIEGNTVTSFTSGANGVYFVDRLPYGKYYLHETKNADGDEVDIWFILTVNENGVGYEEGDAGKETIQNVLKPEEKEP